MSQTKNGTKGPAYKQPEHIKAKSKWTKKTTGWTIFAVVVILGILAIIGADNGWFDCKVSTVVMEDYSVIEVERSDVEVTDDDIESYLDNIIDEKTVYTSVTEGVVEDGDEICIAYEGILEGETEPFEGGSSDDYDLTIGSGVLIDGFEDGIIGHEIGETFDLDLTFPEDYDEELAGKNVTFTVTVNEKTETSVPELTDELVKEYSEENLDETFETIEAYEEYLRDELYTSRLHSAMMEVLQEKATFKSYKQADIDLLKTYSANTLAYYASMFGVDEDTCATYFGSDNASDYTTSDAKSYMETAMILGKIMEDEGVSYTQEELDAAMEEYMIDSGYDDYTLDEFKESSGSAWLWLYENVEFKYDLALSAIEDHVVLVDTVEEESEEAEDTADETIEEEAEEIVDEAEEAAEEIAEDVEEAAEDAEEAVEEAAEDAEEAVEEIADDAEAAVEEVIGETEEAK